MADQQNTQDPHGIYAQMNALRAQIEGTLVRTKKRARWLGIVGLTLAIVLAICLLFAYRAIATIDAGVVVGNLDQELNPYLSEGRFKRFLLDSAPDAIQGLEDIIRDVPNEVRRSADEHMTALVAGEIDDFRKQLVGRMNEELKVIVERLKSEESGGTNDEKVQFIANEIAQVYDEEVTKAFDATYGRYKPKLRQIITDLKKLHAGTDLTRKEQVQRDLILTLFAIARKEGV